MPELIQAIRPGDTPAAIAIDLGPRFATFRTTDQPGDRGAGRLVIDISAQTEAQLHVARREAAAVSRLRERIGGDV